MLYEVVLQATYFQQTVINRWNYVGTGVPAAISRSLGLLNAMGFIPDGGVYPPNTVFTILRSIQSSSLNYVQVSCKAIYDVLDFFETPFTQPLNGLSGGEAMSPAVALGLRTNRVRQDIGRGYKRIAGVNETMLGAGGVVGGGVEALLQNLATEMSDTLTYDDSGNTLTFQPCIVQKEEYTTPSGKKAYRYYPTEVAQNAKLATGVLWSYYTTMRTQNSRQYGHGA